jgi:metal-responsive CopG/Arc/MetJ family transcriptional regulator
MSQYNSRINITIPIELLNQLDEYARQIYSSRSNVIRLALLDWLKSEHTNKNEKHDKLAELLTIKQIAILRQHQKGQLTFAALEKAGITSGTYTKLMELGEL